MKTHHTSLYDNDKNQPTAPVLRQELVTWVETDFGLVKTTMTRTFADDGHSDTYTSQPLVLNKPVTRV